MQRGKSNETTLCSDVDPPDGLPVFKTAEAQNSKAGINAAAFLKIGVGARQVGSAPP